MSDRVDDMDLDMDEITDLEVAEKSQAIINRENFENSIKNLWGHSEVGLEAKRAAMTMLSTKTGMYAKIPIVCKADSCPYSESCQLLAYDLAPLGEYCPIETAQIELRFQGYAQDFDLEYSSFTDRCVVSEIINCDIMIERCKALMAKEGVPVVEVAAGISENGEIFSRPEVSKYWEAYERASKRRNEAYQLMMATRRDKKDKGEREKSVTEIIAEAVADGSLVEIEERPDEFK
jgi:hypothetical protein